MTVRKNDDTAEPAQAGALLAASIRALRDAIAGLGKQDQSSTVRENAATVLVRLGARLEDAQALHEYLSAHPPAS